MLHNALQQKHESKQVTVIKFVVFVSFQNFARRFLHERGSKKCLIENNAL